MENLEKRKVWEWESLREWDDVSAEARDNNQEIHLGFLFGLMVEKGSEFTDEDDERRYFKYRVVFRGNDVKDQNWEVAMFQEMATTPTTLEASRYSDLLATFPGNSVEGRDVEQAYLQADFEGPPTYIVLPKELWTPEMFKMKCPVFRLKRALYGHKNSGAYWQKFCNEQCLKADFWPISDNWPCAYWNEKTQQFLIVYVDDMKLAGPAHLMEEAWAKLGDGIGLEKPKGNVEDSGVKKMTFLGCE